MKLTKKELIKKVKDFIGESTDDAAISLLEDVTDSLSDEDSDLQTKIEELEKEKEELDKSWRQRYIDRFEGKETNPIKTEDNEVDNDDVDDEENTDDEDLTYEELLTENEEGE